MPKVARRSLTPFVALVLASLVCAPRLAAADDTDRCVNAAEEAQRLRRDGHLRAARESLVACARETCPGPVRADCKKWLGEVEADLPTVVVRALEDDGRAISDVRVSIDGAVVLERLDGRAMSVDPGERVFRYERTGRPPIEQRVLVNQGEHDRLVSVVLPAPSAPASAASTTGPWLLGAVGAVALGAGAYLWIKGRSDRSFLYSTCGVTHACSSSDVDAAKAKVLAGDITVAAGVVAIGAAAVWLVTIGSKSAPHVDAALIHGGGFVSYRAAF